MTAVPSREEWIKVLACRHGEKLQKKLSASTAAICGLGGLGSGIAVSLARTGIGNLILIDFDLVDISNLHRQQYKAAQTGMRKTDALSENLYEIAPYTLTKTHFRRITAENLSELLADADIICEAFDEPEEKAMLVNGVLEKLPNKYLIAASGMAGLASANLIKTRRISKNFILCGDGISEASPLSGLFSSRVMLCAAHQAHAAIRIISGETEF